MSFIRHDLICANGHTEPAVFYRRSDGPPPCSECGAETHVGWLRGSGSPSFTGFGQVNVDGRSMSTSDFEVYKRDLEAANPGKRVVAYTPTDAEVDRDIEARKQRILDHRKAIGVDTKTLTEKQTEDLLKKKEGLDRGKVATTNVHRDIAQTEKRIERVKTYETTTT